MVDPNEAPDGYVAVPWTPKAGENCSACVFSGSRFHECLAAPCGSSDRKDHTSVYFVPKTVQPSPVPAQTYTPVESFVPGCETCMFVRDDVLCRSCPFFNQE